MQAAGSEPGRGRVPVAATVSGHQLTPGWPERPCVSGLPLIAGGPHGGTQVGFVARTESRALQAIQVRK